MKDRLGKFQRLTDAKWNFIDITIVLCFVSLTLLFLYFLLFYFFLNSEIAQMVSLYLVAIIMVFSPIVWLKNKYGLTVSALGIQKGNFSIFVSVLIGIASAFIMIVSPFGRGLQAALRIIFYPHYKYLLLLLTTVGIDTVVLVPVSEEIITRGFIYGYLRKRLGIMAAIAVQALIFSLCHFIGFREGNIIGLATTHFVSGIMYGVLYEKTRSLLPSMVCHSMLNYFAFVGI